MIWLLTLFISLSSFAVPKKPVGPDWAYVEKRLSKGKFSKDFLKAVRDSYEPADFFEVLDLNLLLYLRKSDAHGPQVTEDAVKEVQKFLNENSRAMYASEKKYKVPAHTIASLLWIESRFGGNAGRFHVLSVYLHLIQAERPEVVRQLQANAVKFTDKVTKKIEREIRLRTKKKAAWAFDEIKALARMYDRNSKMVAGLRGSFSGAFGMPQFLPSSYVRWSKPASPGVAPDLYSADDAIHSVAHYLKGHGWRKSKDPVKTLMKYNNSEDYAKAILNLSNKAEAAEKRDVSGFSARTIKKKSSSKPPKAVKEAPR